MHTSKILKSQVKHASDFFRDDVDADDYSSESDSALTETESETNSLSDVGSKVRIRPSRNFLYSAKATIPQCTIGFQRELEEARPFKLQIKLHLIITNRTSRLPTQDLHNRLLSLPD